MAVSQSPAFWQGTVTHPVAALDEGDPEAVVVALAGGVVDVGVAVVVVEVDSSSPGRDGGLPVPKPGSETVQAVAG